MTIQELASFIATREDGKSSVKIGDIREIIGVISDVIADEGVEVIHDDLKMVYSDTVKALLKNGRSRKKRGRSKL